MDDKMKLVGVICLALGAILGIAGTANRTYVAIDITPANL
jgi:hypothetical protein